MENSTGRKAFLTGAIASTGAVALAASSGAAANADPPTGFDFEVVDSVHLDHVGELSAQGYEIKAAAAAIVPGGPAYSAGNGSAPLNGYYVLMQRKKP